MSLFLFVLGVWGLTQILVAGEIFDKIRPKHIFFHCPMCIGFHSGWFMYLAFHFCGVALFPHFLFGIFLYGCIGSAVSHALIALLPQMVGYENLTDEELMERWREEQQ